jgi:hypothetical protein
MLLKQAKTMELETTKTIVHNNEYTYTHKIRKDIDQQNKNQ